MPSGRTHEAINLTFFAGLAAGYAYAKSQGLTQEFETLLSPQTVTLFSLSYLVGSFLVTPDLDLAENNVRAKRHWGLLGLLWVPYGTMFNHRGMSHTWILGPLTRLVYMAVVGLALAYAITFLAPYFGYQVQFQAQLSSNWQELALGALLGYYLSQWLHLIADGIAPDHGRKRRKASRPPSTKPNKN
ncbi:MAG: metal-binding protein [Trueperaceae bacterium]|nr:metal-binding protein [Trueperaceae bacterium]